MKRLIHKLKYSLEYSREYGFKCYCMQILCTLFPYKKKGSLLAWRLLQKKHHFIKKYLLKYYKIQSREAINCSETDKEHLDCIWTAWLQGEENAPEVIRLTLASIRKNAGVHKVIVLTHDNIDKYVEVPVKIKQKHNMGIIGNAHYADIVRMMVLAKYGGLWLDATMLLHEEINNNAFNCPFYSVGFNQDQTVFVSNHKWLVRMIGGCRKSSYLFKISEMLNAYWNDHELCIDYFVFDYLIAILYQEDAVFSDIVDSLTKMPFYTNKIKEIINQRYDGKNLEALQKSGQVYYLTYREKYKKTTIDGDETVYGHLVKLMDINSA